jgi:rhomboid protease GluP
MRGHGYRGELGPALGPRHAPVTWAIIAVNAALWTALEVSGGSGDAHNLYRWGAKYGGGPLLGPGILDGEWWRLIVPVFLHVGFFHLLANTFGLIVFGGTVESTFGSVNYAAVYLLSGVLGNVASFWAGPALGAGASGAVFGIIGAFGAYLFLNRRTLGQLGRQSLTSIGVILAINLVFGFVVAGIDNAAHLGGLVAGALLGLALAPRQRLAVRSGPFFTGTPLERVEVKPSALRVAMTLVAGAAAAGLLAYGAAATY